MVNRKDSNPLKLVSILFAIASVIYLSHLIHELATGNTLLEAAANRKHAIVGFFCCCSFFVCYFNNKILAWWIAMFFCAAMFITIAVLEGTLPDEKVLFTVVVVYAILSCYLGPKYKTYKEYLGDLGNNIVPENGLQGNGANLDNNNNLSCSRNPLQTVLYASIIFAALPLINLFTGGGILARMYGESTAYSQQIATLIVVAGFVFCYVRQSIWAWWIALLSLPALWTIYYIFQPFQITQIIASLSVYAVIVWYLIVKYRRYNDYITHQDIGGDNGQ